MAEPCQQSYGGVAQWAQRGEEILEETEESYLIDPAHLHPHLPRVSQGRVYGQRNCAWNREEDE